MGCVTGAFVLVLAGAHAQQSASIPPARGAALFASNCAVCHGPAGAGVPSLAPPLTNYPAKYAQTAEGRRQLALTVLYGIFGEVTVEQKHFNFKMPAFAQLDDSSLADVLNYVVFELAKAGADTQPLASGEIASERGHGLDGRAVRQHRLAVLDELGLQK